MEEIDLSSVIKFNLEYENLLIEIEAILKTLDKDEPGFGHYELYFKSSKPDGEELTHYWPSANFPLEQDDLIESLEHALDEEGMIDHILESWSNLEGAKPIPRWAKKTFQKR
jgi:hypothetical protein